MKEIEEIITSLYPVSMKSLNKIVEIVELAEVKQGDCFIEKGKHNYKEYFILEGVCRSYVLSPDGEEITISFFNPKSVLSPYVTRTVNSISNLTFQAMTHLRLGLINSSKFENLMVEYLDIREFGNNVLKVELQKKVNKELRLASMTAKERLLKFRDEYPLMENLVPHTAIAAFLGITNVSLSRLRKELSK